MGTIDVIYSTDRRLTVEEFVDVLKRSTLSERRPVDDSKVMAAMLKHGTLLWTAWDGTKLVGVARSVTDFEYCCYLSDLAVDSEYQKSGIGRELIKRTQSSLGPKAKLILLSAPNAVEFYPRIGFEPHPSAWIISSRKALT